MVQILSERKTLFTPIIGCSHAAVSKITEIMGIYLACMHFSVHRTLLPLILARASLNIHSGPLYRSYRVGHTEATNRLTEERFLPKDAAPPEAKDSTSYMDCRVKL